VTTETGDSNVNFSYVISFIRIRGGVVDTETRQRAEWSGVIISEGAKYLLFFKTINAGTNSQ
jgi:hypothetical protein